MQFRSEYAWKNAFAFAPLSTPRYLMSKVAEYVDDGIATAMARGSPDKSTENGVNFIVKA